MIGHIESYDPDSQTGAIKSGEAAFLFHLDDWVGAYLAPPKAVKYKYVAATLALLLGFTGLHRFYLGFYWLGIAQLALTAVTVGYGALWGFVEAVLLFTGHINKDAKGRPLK